MYVGPINKDRVTKVYTKRMKKIWTSNLSAYSKYIAHNAFAALDPNELLQSVQIDDGPQLMSHGIRQMCTQKKLKSKAEPFRNKPLHRYVHKKVSENNIDQKLTRQPTSL